LIELIELRIKTLILGKKFAGSGLCGVSILRAGETMEKAIMQVTKQIRLGKLLIQTNQAPDHSLMSHIES